MRIKDFVRESKEFWDTVRSLVLDCNIPVLIHGSKGIGKSFGVKETFRYMDIVRLQFSKDSLSQELFGFYAVKEGGITFQKGFITKHTNKLLVLEEIDKTNATIQESLLTILDNVLEIELLNGEKYRNTNYIVGLANEIENISEYLLDRFFVVECKYPHYSILNSFKFPFNIIAIRYMLSGKSIRLVSFLHKLFISQKLDSNAQSFDILKKQLVKLTDTSDVCDILETCQVLVAEYNTLDENDIEL